jgi:hypothetical protein
VTGRKRLPACQRARDLTLASRIRVVLQSPQLGEPGASAFESCTRAEAFLIHPLKTRAAARGLSNRIGVGRDAVHHPIPGTSGSRHGAPDSPGGPAGKRRAAFGACREEGTDWPRHGKTDSEREHLRRVDSHAAVSPPSRRSLPSETKAPGRCGPRMADREDPGVPHTNPPNAAPCLSRLWAYGARPDSSVTVS